MIQKIHFQDNDGLLVTGEIAKRGIFIFHSVGTAEGYLPWNKIRLYELLWSDKNQKWVNALRFGSAQKKLKLAYRFIDFHTQMADEIILALQQIRATISGLPETLEETREQVRQEAPIRKAAEEMDESQRLIAELEGKK